MILDINVSQPPEWKEIRLNHGKKGASALPRIKSHMAIERKRQYTRSDLLLSLSWASSHLG